MRELEFLSVVADGKLYRRPGYVVHLTFVPIEQKEPEQLHDLREVGRPSRDGRKQ